MAVALATLAASAWMMARYASSCVRVAIGTPGICLMLAIAAARPDAIRFTSGFLPTFDDQVARRAVAATAWNNRPTE